MSSGSTSRRRRRLAIPVLPDVILKSDSLHELGEPEIVIAELEAKSAKAKVKESLSSKRARANELHREADHLYFKGDYESALVLYHRAARLCPQETVHAVAARRTEVALSSAANPPRELIPFLRDSRSPAQMAAVLCPEAAAHRAKAIVTEAQNPMREIPRILRFFDTRKDFWRLSSPVGDSPRNTRSKMMLRQLNKCIKSTVKELESACDTNNTKAVLKLSEELVNLVSLGEKSSRNQVDVYGYLAEKQMALGRHDRAVDLAGKMIFLARTSCDGPALVQALVTLGKVHLKFGHLDALVRVWERLVADIHDEELAQAWLYHDIGRCYLELGNLSRGLDASKLCLERASVANSTKWRLRGELLRGQVLLKFGRFVEAVSALKLAAQLAEHSLKNSRTEEEKEERSMLLGYVQSLIDQVAHLLRTLNEERERRMELGRATDVAAGRQSSFNSIIITNEEEELIPATDACDNTDKQEVEQERARLYSLTDTHEDQTREQEDKEIAQLLKRTRALRGIQSVSIARRDKLEVLTPPRAPSLSFSDTDSTEEEEEENKRIDAYRTRNIHRTSWSSGQEEEEEEILEEMSGSLSLTDFACTEPVVHKDGLEKYSGEETQDRVNPTMGTTEKTNDYDYDEQRKESLALSFEVLRQPEEEKEEKKEKQLTSVRSSSSFTLDNGIENAVNKSLLRNTKQQTFHPLLIYLKDLECNGFEDVLRQ